MSKNVLGAAQFDKDPLETWIRCDFTLSQPAVQDPVLVKQLATVKKGNGESVQYVSIENKRPTYQIYRSTYSKHFLSSQFSLRSCFACRVVKDGCRERRKHVPRMSARSFWHKGRGTSCETSVTVTTNATSSCGWAMWVVPRGLGHHAFAFDLLWSVYRDTSRKTLTSPTNVCCGRRIFPKMLTKCSCGSSRRKLALAYLSSGRLGLTSSR